MASESRQRLRRGERQERIAGGLCPECGEEAAPYLLGWGCRLKPRLNRALARGVKIGFLQRSLDARFSIAGTPSNSAQREWLKWSTPLVLGEDDGRGKPRMRGMRVDVEATLSKVMEHIGRPCTIDEIVAAWGKLRAKRTNPLAGDLGRLIVADAKRARKQLARQAILAKA
jgi:hypothetical protein